MDPRTLVPADKGDIAGAERAVAAGYPAVEPVLRELFEWLQDYNWQVSRVLGPFLIRIGLPIVPEVRRILATDDDIWKYWVLVQLAADASPEVIMALRPEITRIATSPTRGEVEQETDDAARDVLARIGEGLA